MSTKELQRAQWVARVAMAYTAEMSDGQRLHLLGQYFDQAYETGIIDEIKRGTEEIREQTSQILASRTVDELFRRQAE